MRAFIAIDLPIEIKNALSGIQEELKIESLKVSWVKPQNLHLTIKFLGDTSLEQLREIKQTVTEITKTSSAFRIKLQTLGVFPNLQAARIIWIGADQAPLRLKRIAEQLETMLPETGMPQQQRDFLPHITIGRIKNRLDPSDLKKALNRVEKDVSEANWEFDCGKITLFESVLGPAGPTYTVLDQFNLKIT